MKKKVCMIIPSFTAKGGISSVVSGYRGSKLENDYEIKYIQTYCDGNKLVKLMKAIKSYIVFLLYLIKWKPDLVHMHSSFGPSFYRSLPFIYLSSWFRIPIINHIHGSEFDKLYTNASKWKKQRVKKAWRKCDQFIVLSSEWMSRFSKVIPLNKMYVIHNYSIPHGVYASSNNVILFLGAINEMKGCYDAVEVISDIKEKIPDVRLVMAGDGDVDRVREKAREYGLEKNILFPGWVRGDRKDRYLQKCRVFFLPSYSEGMPMSILEAMGYGKPVVSTNVGGIPKIVKNDGNGYLCNPGDIKAFSSSLSELLTDKEKSVKMGKSSYEKIISDYSLDIHITQLETVYTKLIKKH